MRFRDPIFPITDVVMSGMTHADQVRRLIGTGVGVIQLREKRLPAREFAEDARSAIEIAKRSNIKIIINDRVDIALALGADGVHLGQTDLSPEHARQILGTGAIIGFSTHSAEQAALAVTYPIDYVAAGPVFPTKTKEEPDHVIGIDALTRIREIVKTIPLVAIGGIGLGNIASVSETGVDAAALIGAVFGPGNDVESAVKLLQANWAYKNV